MILTCSLRFLTLPLIKFSFSFSVFCGNRTGIVFMIFLSLYVFLRFLTWRLVTHNLSSLPGFAFFFVIS